MGISRNFERFRAKLRTPYCQNFIVGILIGLTGGLYVALNLLGAGGGKPNSASTINTANAVLCTVYAVSAFSAGTVLNKLGPSLTAFFGVIGYIVYIASLWHFDRYAVKAFPIVGAVCLGTSAGLIYVTQGYISMSYSEESERGMFVSTALNLQAVGAVIGGAIPLAINSDKSETTGVPAAVYIVFIAMDVVGAAMTCLLAPPEKVIRADGTDVADIKSLTFMEELYGTFRALRDWKLWLMIPSFLPSQSYLVYCGSVNVYQNSLRARCLLSFCAVVLQIIVGCALQYALDHPKMNRRTRAIFGLCVVGVPLLGAWIWEIVRVHPYDRNVPEIDPVDWDQTRFAPIFILFMMNWTFSALWQYIIMYFLGCFTNNPRFAANNAGVFRGFMAIGEAVSFGVDSRKTPYVIEASIIFGFYATGFMTMGYLSLFVIEDSKYFQEEEVTIPEHVKEERSGQLKMHGEDGEKRPVGEQIENVTE